MPGSGWMKQALFVRHVLRQSLDIPYEMVARGLVSTLLVQMEIRMGVAQGYFQKAGTARPCVVATLLEAALAEGTLTPQHEDDIKGVAGAILAGAYDFPIL